MDLRTVYELRERLEAAAIAGTGLLSEDFRFRRALQQIGPLAEASPVFKKIQNMAEQTIEAEQKERPGLLLDTLALLDAVLCTQGGLETPGEVEPISGERIGTIKELSYSRLAPLAEAFVGTGGGRYGRISDSHQQDPELFEDYRVKRLMIRGLADGYGELAELTAQWLQKEGKAIVGVLKADFDPKGKREMARRVEIIEAVAGAEENEFFRAAAVSGVKEIKAAAIRALRCSQENDGFLLELVKTEKGSAKDAALSALACMDSLAVQEFWNTYMRKHARDGVSFLSASTADWASDLTAEQIRLCLEARPEQAGKRVDDGNRRNWMRDLWYGAARQHSQKLCDCCEPAFQEFPGMVTEFLINGVLDNSHPRIRETLHQMYEAHKDAFLEGVFLDALIQEEPAQVYERFCGCFEGTEDQESQDVSGIIKALLRMEYREGEGRYVLYQKQQLEDRNDCLPAKARLANCQPRGLDPRWYPLFLHYEGPFGTKGCLYDRMLTGLFHSGIPGLKEEYGAYFYKSALNCGTESYHISMLKRCEWKNYRGLLTAVVERERIIGLNETYRLEQLLSELPMNRDEKIKELDEILACGRIEGRCRYRLRIWKERLEQEQAL